MNENQLKPIKRHEALHPLSRHHHHGLVIAQRLSRPNDEPAMIQEMKADLQHFWMNGGNKHFEEEEQILLPTYANYGEINRTEIIDMLLEHVKIRSLIGQILHQDSPCIETMNKLGTMLRDHIRSESCGLIAVGTGPTRAAVGSAFSASISSRGR